MHIYRINHHFLSIYHHPWGLSFSQNPYRVLTGPLPVVKNLTALEGTGKESGKVFLVVDMDVNSLYCRSPTTLTTGICEENKTLPPYRLNM